MLEFFILFIVTGFIIGFIQLKQSIALAVIFVISVIWMFAYGPWALATLIELLLGYGLALKIQKDKKANT